MCIEQPRLSQQTFQSPRIFTPCLSTHDTYVITLRKAVLNLPSPFTPAGYTQMENVLQNLHALYFLCTWPKASEMMLSQQTVKVPVFWDVTPCSQASYPRKTMGYATFHPQTRRYVEQNRVNGTNQMHHVVSKSSTEGVVTVITSGSDSDSQPLQSYGLL
jgi:hypothetical protein